MNEHDVVIRHDGVNGCNCVNRHDGVNRHVNRHDGVNKRDGVNRHDGVNECHCMNRRHVMVGHISGSYRFQSIAHCMTHSFWNTSPLNTCMNTGNNSFFGSCCLWMI